MAKGGGRLFTLTDKLGCFAENGLLKDIIVRYYTQKDNHLLYSVLFDIISCARDLDTHCSVEDRRIS